MTPDRFLTLEPRPITEDERALCNHLTRWGSDGNPVRKFRSGKWTWGFRSVEAPTVYRTKREALAAFERFHALLLDLLAYESWQRAVRERDARGAS